MNESVESMVDKNSYLSKISEMNLEELSTEQVILNNLLFTLIRIKNEGEEGILIDAEKYIVPEYKGKNIEEIMSKLYIMYTYVKGNYYKYSNMINSYVEDKNKTDDIIIQRHNAENFNDFIEILLQLKRFNSLLLEYGEEGYIPDLNNEEASIIEVKTSLRSRILNLFK